MELVFSRVGGCQQSTPLTDRHQIRLFEFSIDFHQSIIGLRFARRGPDNSA
jgi:hypothetical protein